MNCPQCNRVATKAIYAGLPMNICEGDPECQLLWGFWSWIPELYFNGVFMSYDGSYLNALWHWIFGMETQ